MKPILNFWQYYKLPDIRKAIDELKIDKLIFEHLPYPLPHKELDKFVTDDQEYTHVIIVTNDVLVTQENLDTLLEDVRKNPDKIQSAVMNVDTDELKHHLNICLETPDKEYKWVSDDIEGDYLEVKFAGFPLMAIPMEIAKKYDFHATNTGNEATDRRFCLWCEKNAIPITVNLKNRMKHFRYAGEKPTVEPKRVVKEIQ